MLLSELIKELQKIISAYGDYRVILPPREEETDLDFVVVTEDANGERLVELE